MQERQQQYKRGSSSTRETAAVQERQQQCKRDSSRTRETAADERHTSSTRETAAVQETPADERQQPVRGTLVRGKPVKW